MDPELIYKTAEAEETQRIRVKKIVTWVLVILLILIQVAISLAQTNVNNNTFNALSTFKPEIKESNKVNDQPDIKDTVKRITNIKYGIASNPLFPKYEVQKIESAKMQNEPLAKLYHSLIKVGYGPLYNSPYGEFFVSNIRSRDMAYGARIKHFSSSSTLDSTGFGGFSDNIATVYGKKFYKKHTLNGDLNYSRNVVHYYGYNANKNTLKNDYTKQRYQLIEPKLLLQSHYTDSTHMNHIIGLSFYNLQNLNQEAENNICANANLVKFINKEKLNIDLSTNFYNHKQSNDTLNDLIISVAPAFEAQGKKWKAILGLKGTLDNFKGKTRFYGYPQLNVEYDVYESMVIPYAGATGGLIKNSMRSLTGENPFADTTLSYTNTNNKYNLFLGLKGNLSSNTSYDVKGSYSQMDSLHFYTIDYSGANTLYNHFNILYDNASVMNVSGALKYQLREKMHFIATGNYYIYKTKNLTRAYHKPDYDLTLSAIYNLKSKIIVRGDIFVIGKQWVQTQVVDVTTSLQPKQINGLVDVNLEAEYRYSKMLSFFVKANNIANQRYNRWERYPTQRLNFTIGLTFVPF
ncbi:MAG: hypothetical protein IPI93_02740 [Sphingobacteriaceae bacterium]|nr:hypothetical protein [Sphingobacteriaceae bacterium]